MLCLPRRDRQPQRVPDALRVVRLQDNTELHMDSGKIFLACLELLLVDLSLRVAFLQDVER